MSDSGQLNR